MTRLIYLLDSEVLSEPTKSVPNVGVLDKLEQFGPSVCTAAVVIHELRFGAASLPEGKQKAALTAYLNGLLAHPIVVLPYDEEAALYHATERARLKGLGYNASFADGQIAAIAKVSGLALATRYPARFQHFQGLRVENWFD